VYANLGNAATLYRGAATGAADGVNNYSFLDINATLVSAFGAGWATDTDLYAGLAGVWGSSSTLLDLQDGDPQRTLYVSSSRTAVGTIGQANSSGYTVATAGDMTGAASAIEAQNAVLENSYTTAVAQSPTSTSQIDDKNPLTTVSGNTFQGTAFGAFSGGVQQRGGTFSASFGDAGDSVFALDLYRIQARTTIAGQVGLGETARVGTYEGTFSVGNDGTVSFIATVPEPSTYALMGLSAVVIGFVVRRRRAQNL
jgi:hypothetical protein